MKKLLILFLGIFFISFALSTGCCFDPFSGTCSKNANSCTNGQFTSDPTCASVSECNYGCCTIGKDVRYMTQATCYLESQSTGSAYSWLVGDEQKCIDLKTGFNGGACIVQERNSRICKFTSFDNCKVGEFNPGKLCSDSALNTTCKKTDKTTCLNGDVYFVDSCDNPDVKKESCSASEGESCTMAGLFTAKCQDMNCHLEDGSVIKNGEKWCTNGEFFTEEQLINFMETGSLGSDVIVGSAGSSGEVSGTPVGTTPAPSTNTGGSQRATGGLSGFLWKPVSDSNGKLVVLYSGSKSGAKIIGPDGKTIESGSYSGFANGNRHHYRFSKSGSSYPSGSILVAGSKSCLISSPGSRIESCQSGSKGTSKTTGKVIDEFLTGNAVQNHGQTDSSSESSDGSAVSTSASGVDGMPLAGTDPRYWTFSQLVTYLKNNPTETGAEESTGETSSEGFGEDAEESGGGIEVLYEGSEARVGTRGFAQSCQNGEIVTEPCEDFRFGVCGEANECVANPWTSCLAFGENFDEESCSANPACTIFGFGEDPLIQELKIDACVPMIPGGIQFYDSANSESSGSGLAGGSEICAQANYESVVKFKRLGPSLDDCWALVSDDNEWGSAGLIYGSNEDMWKKEGSYLVNPDSGRAERNDPNANPLLDCRRRGGSFFSGNDPDELGFIWRVATGLEPGIPINKPLVRPLKDRCRAIGDCQTKLNYIFDEGELFSATNLVETELESGAEFLILPCTVSGDEIECKFELECAPWKAPAHTAFCGVCGLDGVPCSEYRCKSLGQGCEYFEANGIDSGYCASSQDTTPPAITARVNPPSPVPPYSAVEITLTTDEEASCSFSLNGTSEEINDMPFRFDGERTKEHKAILSVPGKKFEGAANTPAYSLIKDDGKYDVYVKCEDNWGNSNSPAQKVSFEVMQTPDRIAPKIMNWSPAVGSLIPFGTSSREIRFRLNEPAECRWSTNDTSYENMANNFSCNTLVSDASIVNGYFCSGNLTGVTDQTRYFVRCNDQPWLAGNETDLYSRNVNTESTIYYLRLTSSPLEITTISPMNQIVLGANANFSINVRTNGGAEFGRAVCKYRFIVGNASGSYSNFANTSSINHMQEIVNKTEGNYELEVSCIDSVGNNAVRKVPLKIEYDRGAPFVSRIFNNKGTLTVATNEPAVCKFMNVISSLSCAFSLDSTNATAMFGPKNTEHTTAWNRGRTYFIKCEDFYKNVNSGCGIVAKAF